MPQLPDLPRKLLVDKKGFTISYKMVMWIPRFLFTVVVISVTLYIIQAIIVTRTNVSEQESDILMNVAHYSKGGFSAFDKDIGRVYPGVVNSSRFSTAQLSQLFAMDKPLIVGRFVKKQTAVDYFLNPQPDSVAYTDETRYLRWEPIAQVGAKGEGSKVPYPEIRYVAIKNGAGSAMETVFITSN